MNHVFSKNRNMISSAVVLVACALAAGLTGCLAEPSSGGLGDALSAETGEALAVPSADEHVSVDVRACAEPGETIEDGPDAI
jgi:hypothetical protein